ncbi:MAG: hypothetical protein EP343_29805 [Deltaproteobacteria bacterium]|nr:MAG: hypothetical protein EP343_29805 [Deltaproteobacteria bacterium]
MNRKPARSKQQAGFTLAEMMAVTILSTLSVTFIFYLSISQSRLARLQDDIANMQSALQFASTRIERDIRRAGFMSLVSNNDPRLCVPFNFNDFRAIRFTNSEFDSSKTKMTVKSRSGEETLNNPNVVEADEIELMANFATTKDYPAAISPDNPNKIIIDLAGTDVADERAFKRAFYTPNQLLFIKGLTGKVQVVQVDTSKPFTNVYDKATARAELFINSNLPLRNTVRCGISIRFRVAPILKVRYRVRKNPASNYWELWRQVLSPSSCNSNGRCTWAPMPTSSPFPPLVIAERVADLQFWFATAHSSRDFNGLDPMCTGTTVKDCEKGSTAQLGRDKETGWPVNDDIRAMVSVYFRLSIHMESEDPEFPHIQRKTLDDALLTFDLNPKVDGSARVRTLSKQIQLVNFLVR